MAFHISSARSRGAAQHTCTGQDTSEQINDQFHGQSGGPVYRVIDANPAAGEVVDRLEFVGIIYNRLMDLVLARPSALINAQHTASLGLRVRCDTCGRECWLDGFTISEFDPSKLPVTARTANVPARAPR